MLVVLIGLVLIVLPVALAKGFVAWWRLFAAVATAMAAVRAAALTPATAGVATAGCAVATNCEVRACQAPR